VGRVVSIRDGKISSERIMKGDYASRIAEAASFNSGGERRFSEHEEFAILDRNGRVQIPAEYLARLGIKGDKVKMSVRDGEIVITPPG
jgi:AbrB family looped-hinge helix DNA binding protein